MKKLTFLIATTIFFFLASSLYAQKTSLYNDANLAYKKGLYFYDKGLYGQAQNAFADAMTQLPPHSLDAEAHLLKTTARLYYAKAAVQREWQEGETLVADFIRTQEPTGMANDAKLEMADYYYNSKKYEEAIRFYDMIDPYSLSVTKRTETYFKKGYALFVRKENAKAKQTFANIKDQPSDYYHHANYYYAMTVFFDGDYASALEHFEKANATKKYDRVVPYYIAQIHFAQKEYDKVIRICGEALRNNSELRNKTEMAHLLGQAYFEKQQYADALPYLEKNISENNNLRPEDLYQTGFTQYKMNKFADAVKQFEQLDKQNNALGQSALYTLADCYLRLNDRTSARNAFGKASRMNFDAKMKEESLFNYAKLSYELGYQNDAINAIQALPQNSQYTQEGQSLLSNIFLNTRNYSSAMRIIESMPNKSKKMLETYQQVTYLQGATLYAKGDLAGAKEHFQLSLKDAIDSRTTALAMFWLSDINHQNNNYDASIQQLKDYFKYAEGEALPDEASIHSANYLLAYNYLKKQNYVEASNFFGKAVKGIKEQADVQTSEYLQKRLLPDAILRTGDVFFKQNKYKQAKQYYKEAITKKYTGFDYALFQQATIEGLEGQLIEKLLGMEELSEKYPNSSYADDALYSLGTSYLEIGKNDLAEKAFTKMITTYKNQTDLLNKALLKLGLLSFNQNETTKALSYYKQIFKNNPTQQESKEALENIQEIYVNLGKADDYFAFLETIPNYSGTVDQISKDSINFKVADAQYENGQYEKAIEAYSKYLLAFPNGRNTLKAHFNRAESNLILKRYDNAMIDYEAIIEKGSNIYYTVSLFKAGEIAYNHQKDFKKAYQFYSKLANIATKEEDKLNGQLGALRSAWRSEQLDQLPNVADLVIQNPKASKQQKGIAHFYKAKALLQAKDYAKSLESFKQTIALSGNIEEAAESRYRVASIQYIQKNLNGAKETCLSTYSEIPDYDYWIAKSSLLLSDIFVEQNDRFNARAVLEGLLESFTSDKAIIEEAKAKLSKIDSNTNSRLAPNKPKNEREMDKPID